MYSFIVIRTLLSICTVIVNTSLLCYAWPDHLCRVLPLYEAYTVHRNHTCYLRFTDIPPCLEAIAVSAYVDRVKSFKRDVCAGRRSAIDAVEVNWDSVDEEFTQKYK